MNYLDSINRDNFHNMFNLGELLKDSVYYPASGIDASDIECLSRQYRSFIHADYSLPEPIVQNAMENDFQPVGYELIGIRHIFEHEITPNGFNLLRIPNNQHENERLQYDFILRRYRGIVFKPFALWAVYQLNEQAAQNPNGKVDRFSLLHVGGEACATLDVLYRNNNINPSAVAIINPSEGYGDNWTRFTDPQFRFYQILLHNANVNGANMPERLLNMCNGDHAAFWPDYQNPQRCRLLPHLCVYSRV